MASIILVILLVLSPVILLAISMYRKFRNHEPNAHLLNVRLQDINATEILKDLNLMIDIECEKFKQTTLTYSMAKHSTMMNMSSMGSVLTVISDSMLEEETQRISSSIIDRMSDIYRDKLLLVLSEDYIDTYIYEETYGKLLQISIQINTNTSE